MTTSDPEQPLTADDALADVVDRAVEPARIESTWQEQNEMALLDGEERWTKIRGLEKHFEHKSLWSNVLIGTIAWMVIFESILVAFVGWGWWDFTDYAWLVPTLMIQFLAQIVSLGILVVKSLFKDMV